MSAYATLCPRFRKINLAEAGIVQTPGEARALASAPGFLLS
jgi:hypothetical protein